MKHPKFLIFAVFAIILITAAGTTFAQSTDRDHPTPLNSSEVSGSFGAQKEGNKEIFYSFTAGPGDLTITIDVKGRNRDASGSMAFELLQGNGSEENPLLCCEYAQMGGGKTGRGAATVKLTRRQTVILHLTNSFYGGGIFNVRLSGRLSSAALQQADGGYSDGGSNGQPVRGNRGGEQINVPASGTLHIRMKNGTTKDIDLNLIQNITVRP